MKNLITILVMVFAISFATNGQKKRKMQKPNFTAEQHTNLAIKKMTLSLDLSEKQQNQIRPLLMAQITQKKAALSERKEAKKNKKRPTSDEIYAMKSKQLDNQIMMKNRMQDILNKTQFEKFEKMQKRRKMMAMKKMQKRKGEMQKKGKMKKRKKTEQGK
ncbi:MAG: hypothetical protein AB8B78_04875 [Polaribacter sp.]